jgi:hypothetical protein
MRLHQVQPMRPPVPDADLIVICTKCRIPARMKNVLHAWNGRVYCRGCVETTTRHVFGRHLA